MLTSPANRLHDYAAKFVFSDRYDQSAAFSLFVEFLLFFRLANTLVTS
jgi:hypothetical protein